MAKRLLYGKYYQGRDSAGRTYYYRRSDGKRVSSEVVSNFVRRKASQAAKRARNAPRIKSGRFVGKKDFEDLFQFMLRHATEEFDRSAMKRVLKFWTQEEFEQNLDIARGMLPRSWWFTIISFESERRASFEDLTATVRKHKGFFFWKEEKVTFVQFKANAFGVAQRTETRFLEQFKDSDPTIYHIDLLMRFNVGKTEVDFGGRSRVISSEGEIEYSW